MVLHVDDAYASSSLVLQSLIYGSLPFLPQQIWESLQPLKDQPLALHLVQVLLAELLTAEREVRWLNPRHLQLPPSPEPHFWPPVSLRLQLRR